MESGRCTGGIFKLRELISEHPSELAYDFRSRFNIGIQEIGYRVPYSEAVLLAAILLRDPTSWLQAAYNQWKHPASLEWIMLAQQLEAFVAAHSKTKPKPIPMPWQAPIRSGRPSLPEERVREILDAMRPKETDG